MMRTAANRHPTRAALLVVIALALSGCATTPDAPQGSSPADKLRKAESGAYVEGELQVTVGRTL